MDRQYFILFKYDNINFKTLSSTYLYFIGFKFIILRSL